MTKSESVAKKIYIETEVWKKDHAKLVVAIDGYAGSGKTTVANFIGKQGKDILVIHLDDFIKHWKVRKHLINKAKDKSEVFEYHWYRYAEVKKLIKAFLANKKSISVKTYNYEKNDFNPKKAFDLSKKVLVLDGVFLFHPKHKINKLIDKKIYLDTEFSRADKKRIAREKKKWGKDYLSENHSDNWTKYFKQAYRGYISKYKPEDQADLVFEV